MQLEPSQLDQIKEICLRHYPSCEAIFLYGSRAHGTAVPDSDVDLGLLLPRDFESRFPIGASDCWMELERALGLEVDLVSVREESPLLQYEMVWKGSDLWAKDRDVVSDYAARVICDYEEVSYYRAPILQRIRETGVVYDL